ncbi:hypothetical protein [Lactococcus taiwanensis]|uniref:hypothetical protein n=1 Tax=Lactococcus taiwanensis TaxID=1151742 RepID=UPI0023F0B050|nr:hypothetical protein [Lactococcus taiwanensis]
MDAEHLVNYSSEEFDTLSQFQQEEITNNFKQAILYKMKEKSSILMKLVKKQVILHMICRHF